ncbi:g1384 [Coccomyxa elongata]
MTYTLADRAAAEGRPMLEVRRVALNDGSHASLILENGRISKLVAPSGEVARLHWEEDMPSPRPPSTAINHQPGSQSERCDTLPAKEKKTFVSARQFWANMPDPSKAPGKNEASTRGRSSVIACSTPGASDSSEVTSPSPRVPGKALASPSAEQPQLPEDLSYTESCTGSSDRTQETEEGSNALLQAQETVQQFMASSKARETAKKPSQDEAQPYPSVTDGSTRLASCHTEGGLATAEEQDSADSSSGTPEAHTNIAPSDDSCSCCPKLAGCAPAHHASLSHDCPEKQNQPCLEDSEKQAASASLEDSHRQSAARDTLEVLLGDTPRIDMRRMRAEVASLPQLVSAAERAKMAAGKRVKRSSRAGMQPPHAAAELPAAPGAQPPPPAGPEPATPDAAVGQRPAHSAGEAYPPRAAIFEDYPASPRPAANVRVAPTTQQQARRLRAELPAEAASAGVSSGESVGSPADARGDRRAGNSGKESADGDSAAGLSADSVSSAARRRHSLADIRRAIAALPSHAGAQSHSAGVDLAAALLVPANPGNSKSLQTKVQTKSTKHTVWHKITAAFTSRRVQPQASSDTGSPKGSLGIRPGSSSSGSSCTKRSLARRLFGDRTFVRRASVCSEAHVPVPTEHMQTPGAVPPVPVECAVLTSPLVGGTHERRGPGRTRLVAREPVSSSSTVHTPSSARSRASHHGKAPCTRTGMAGRWLMEPCEGAMAGMEAVETLLDLPLLQRLALHRAVELEILETDESLEIVQEIPLNVGGTRIRRRSLYPKSGAVVEETRTDSREGVLRSQLTISPDGHCHIRSLQGEPYAAVFHKRIKMSSGGHRIKIEQKFQLLAPGVLPIKYHSIWHRVEEENAGGRSANGNHK